MLLQHFIIEGRPRGTAKRSFVKQPGNPIGHPTSYAYFCPTCGEVWALCPVVGPDGKSKLFQSVTRACRKHPAQPFTTEPSGVLHLSFDPDFSQAFPDEVVQWEFNRYMEFL